MRVCASLPPSRTPSPAIFGAHLAYAGSSIPSAGPGAFLSDVDLPTQKRTLRRALKAVLRALPEQTRRAGADASVALCGHCTGRTALFVSMRDEFDTGPLDDALRHAEVPRAYPVYDRAGLRFVEVPDDVVGRHLPQDRLGIPTADVAWPVAIDVQTVIVPGLAFDRRGGRLGRGLGLYDRYLSAHQGVRAIGLFYDEQEVERCPTGPHDQRLREVFTPRGGLVHLDLS